MDQRESSFTLTATELAPGLAGVATYSQSGALVRAVLVDADASPGEGLSWAPDGPKQTTGGA